MATRQDTSAPAQPLPHQFQAEFHAVHKAFWTIGAQCKILSEVSAEGCNAVVDKDDLSLALLMLAQYAEQVNAKLEEFSRQFEFAEKPEEDEGQGHE